MKGAISMRCTNCSREVRPVVAIDIDGTLGDYHGHFCDFAEDWLGADIVRGTRDHGDIWHDYDGSEPHRDWFCRTYGVDVTTFRAIKLAFRQGGMKRLMPVYSGAAELTSDLRLAGAEVWVTTTRPWDRFDRVDPDTREWLRRHAIGYDGLLYDENKMEALAALIEPERVCFVLDDLPEVLEAADQVFRPGVSIMRSTHYNRGVKWPVKAAGLAEAKAMAAAHILEWETRNA